MALASKAAKALMRGAGSSADERTSRFLNLPGYDMDTEEAIKELTKKSKTKEGLTPREEKRLDSLMNRKMREGAAEKPSGMASEGKVKSLSEKEKKDMQESLEFKKGGMVKKKYMAGGMGVKGLDKAAEMSGRTVGTANKRLTTMPAMAKGGMSEANYAKGGMVKANCGASMKPAGGSRNK